MIKFNFSLKWVHFLLFVFPLALNAYGGDFQRVLGESCSTGYQLTSVEEAKKNKDVICNTVLERWDIIRLTNGGSMDGPGYGCKIKSTDTRQLGGVVCQAVSPGDGQSSIYSEDKNHQQLVGSASIDLLGIPVAVADKPVVFQGQKTCPAGYRMLTIDEGNEIPCGEYLRAGETVAVSQGRVTRIRQQDDDACMISSAGYADSRPWTTAPPELDAAPATGVACLKAPGENFRVTAVTMSGSKSWVCPGFSKMLSVDDFELNSSACTTKLKQWDVVGLSNGAIGGGPGYGCLASNAASLGTDDVTATLCHAPIIKTIDVSWVEPPQQGQPYMFYGNGNQQAPIQIKFYLDKYDPDVDVKQLLASLRFYKEHTAQTFGWNEFVNNVKVVKDSNDYAHGIFNRNSSLQSSARVSVSGSSRQIRSGRYFGNNSSFDVGNKSDIPGTGRDGSAPSDDDCVYREGVTSPCLSANVYLQVKPKGVGSFGVCVAAYNAVSQVDICNGDVGYSLKATAVAPVQFSAEDFTLSVVAKDFHNQFGALQIYRGLSFRPNGNKPRLLKLFPSELFPARFPVQYNWGRCIIDIRDDDRKCYSMVTVSKAASSGYLGVDAAPGVNVDVSTIEFGTMLDLTMAIGILTLDSKSVTQGETFSYLDMYGNSGSVVLDVCYGDAC